MRTHSCNKAVNTGAHLQTNSTQCSRLDDDVGRDEKHVAGAAQEQGSFGTDCANDPRAYKRGRGPRAIDDPQGSRSRCRVRGARLEALADTEGKEEEREAQTQVRSVANGGRPGGR